MTRRTNAFRPMPSLRLLMILLATIGFILQSPIAGASKVPLALLCSQKSRHQICSNFYSLTPEVVGSLEPRAGSRLREARHLHFPWLWHLWSLLGWHDEKNLIPRGLWRSPEDSASFRVHPEQLLISKPPKEEKLYFRLEKIFNKNWFHKFYVTTPEHKLASFISPSCFFI